MLHIFLCRRVVPSDQMLIMYSSHAHFCGIVTLSSDNVLKSLSVFGEFLFLYLFSGVFLNKRVHVFLLLFFGKQKSLR